MLPHLLHFSGPPASSSLAGGVGDEEEGGATTSTQKTPMGLHIQYMICEADQKLEQLILFLREHSDKKIIVYFLTCRCGT